ncbi:bifunctional riboflavin kinase/FAD synthetase [Sulfurimonas sp. HSL-3221]|uniref:bifunctional riboflavin kinase/FAD synthetase n=1 Tax=Sulfurimonadaceae TaxID=2771471 RepID=UPI001E383D4B|nr:bifunctional riboflavin kinase/FAD synthetase [Sulfurimonas sp. HSL-3221]UFS63408.1 bifunctional riboflavin kinase/FAD synthetase [Sulfurimonas sp. HSL-3221]
MKHATALKKVDAVAIGGFDGMHEGHQHLFNALGERGAIVVVETGYANLTPGREREHFTTHPIVYLPLDEIRMLDDRGFVDYLRERFPALSRIVVGYDFRFGLDRKFSHEDLSKAFSGTVQVIDEVTVGGESVHSHKIRAKLIIGDVRGANRFLGHNYTVRGDVVRGQGIGKKELVPTVNMLTDGFLLPKEGVYASLARLDGEEHYHPAVSFVGHRVTTDGSFAVETHVLDGEIVCKERIDVSFVQRLRGNEKFASLDALKEQIGLDIAAARKAVGRLEL